jgi:predicted signal transduction protein with EAL and GGDEF domain
MQRALGEPIDLAGHLVTVTGCVGIASGDAGYEDADEVLRDADIAMYEAKATRPGSYRFFDRRWHQTPGDGAPRPTVVGKV